MSLPSSNLSIMVVDDQPRMRWTIKEMIRRMGCQNFVEADDGDVAIELLKNHTVDLVLCDWRMPRANGVEVLRHVREDDDLRSLPFVMVTAEMGEEVVAECGELEVDGYLLKPFTLAQLEDKIKDVLARRANLSALETRLELALTYVRSNQLDKALAEYQEALKLNAKSPRTLLAIGQVFERQGNDQRARDCYRQAVGLAPKFIKAHEALAKLYQKLGQAQEAIEHLQEAAKISPKNVERHFQLANALASAGRKKEAMDSLKAVLRVSQGQYADVSRRVGEATLAMGLASEAEAAFKKALEASPDDIHLYNRLGIAFRRQGKFAEAIENYQKALSKAPKNEGLMYNLSRAYLDSGDTAQARQVLLKALEINPGFEEARELLASLSA